MGDSRDPYAGAAHQLSSQLQLGQRRPKPATVAGAIAITQLTEGRRYDPVPHAPHTPPHASSAPSHVIVVGQANLSDERTKAPGGYDHQLHRPALNTNLAPPHAAAQLALTLDISNPRVDWPALQTLSAATGISFHPPESFGRLATRAPIPPSPVSPPRSSHPGAQHQLLHQHQQHQQQHQQKHQPTTKRHLLPSSQPDGPRKRRQTIDQSGAGDGAAAQMPFMKSDLAILNAEQYNDGVPFASPRASLTKKTPSPIDLDDGSGPRKRAKTKATTTTTNTTTTTTTIGDGEEEGGKKARGRPRLDTKDETAAERRRTQIRLAQRAYRNRKENAITTLEKQVQDLRDTNEEMSNEFMKLHDFALSQGLLEQMPEFGRQLRATTQRFLALAQQSSDENSIKDGESAKSPGRESAKTSGGSAAAAAAAVSASELRKAAAAAATPSPRTALLEVELVEPLPLPLPAPTKVHGWGGYIVSHESSPATTAVVTAAAAAVAEELTNFSLPTLSPPTTTSQAFDFEVIAQPTFENASFPFLMPPGSDSPPQPPPLSSFFEPLATITAAPLSPYPAVASPKSYAVFETTFGRRLQRVAIERAYALITAPNPDPVRFARVFGFCSVFEPIDKIRDRLRAGLDRSRQETLNYWQYPFVNLGGAGTHFPGLDDLPSTTTTTTTTTRTSSTSNSDPPSAVGTPHPIGNKGTLEPLRPRFGTGFSTGPFTSGVSSARDTKLDPRLRIMMPGFEGSFYDCDEIELYLQQRGVDIPAGADTVVADVDMAAFHDDADVPNIPGTDAPAGLFGPSTAELAAVVGLQGLDGITGAGGFGLGSSSAAWPAGVASGLFSFGGLAHDITATMSTRKVVTLDVNVLVKELVERATCLGRTPGFRQSDVNAAFWIATRTDVVL